MGEIVQGKIATMDEDGGVIIRAALPSIDRAILRRYDKVLVEFADGRRISPEQRKKAYALMGEIAEWIGDVPEYVKKLMKIEFMASRMQTIGEKIFSLSDTDVTTARLFISFLIDFMLDHQVPSRVPLYELCEDVQKYVYACLMHKACCVCGKRADVHHISGSRAGHGGLKWREKDQDGAKVLPLCREHHRIIHDGEKEFLEKYHLEGIQMTKEIARLYKAKMKDEVKQ
jgi:hypothetical protein